MRISRALLVLSLAAAAVLALGAVALAGVAHTTVSPSKPGRHARVVVRFTAPDAAGLHGAARLWYAVHATRHGGSQQRDCSAQAADRVSLASAGQRVQVTFGPPHAGWCKGTFHGEVDEVREPYCKAAMCPMPADFVDSERQIGSFTFRVR